MDILSKSVFDLLSDFKEFKNDTIKSLEFVFLIDLLGKEDFNNFVNDIRKLSSVDEIVEMSKKYLTNSPDNILIFNALTNENKSYIILVEDKEELYEFLKIMEIILI